MGIAKKLLLGVVSLVPAVALGVAAWAFLSDSAPAGVASAAVITSGLTDLFLAPFFIPHVHDNRRLGQAARIVWLALIGFPYMTVAPIYWAMYMLRERPGDRAPAPFGGAWYPDPWGHAPLRWWDGAQWTDHVSGPQAPVR
ncbi:MAG: hypothetical protein QOJ12_1280 [Thermoleophilales bacterium]|nr:hypothetical protein [Thermoleophilales bacterium]